MREPNVPPDGAPLADRSGTEEHRFGLNQYFQHVLWSTVLPLSGLADRIFVWLTLLLRCHNRGERHFGVQVND